MSEFAVWKVSCFPPFKVRKKSELALTQENPDVMEQHGGVVWEIHCSPRSYIKTPGGKWSVDGDSCTHSYQSWQYSATVWSEIKLRFRSPHLASFRERVGATTSVNYSAGYPIFTSLHCAWHCAWLRISSLWCWVIKKGFLMETSSITLGIILAKWTAKTWWWFRVEHL